MRYERQILMPEIGQDGQEKLNAAKVLVIGAGGLGSPVLTYLAAAGIGHIIIVDYDVVAESNLNRQFLYGTKDIGRSKGLTAAEKLRSINPDIDIAVISTKIDEKNSMDIIRGIDVVVDCVDSIAARLIVNSACLKQDIPLVEGGVCQFYGYVMCIRRESACLRCMDYKQQEKPAYTPVIGCTAGVIGSLQATECIKILLNIGEPLFSKMLTYDGLRNSFDLIELKKDDQCGELHNF
ncbi:MAG: HesA/MoeB/ThiF family protein [Eubacteriales bacterium]